MRTINGSIVLTKVLKMKSLDPNTFIQVVFNKQSKETIISEAYPAC